MWEYNYSYSNELYHHGVKGMRWGHRKQRQQVGFVRSLNRTQDKVYRVDQEFAKKRESINNTERSRSARIVTNLLAGSFANRSYASIRAAGGSKNKARAVTALTSIGADAVSTLATSATAKILPNNALARSLVQYGVSYAGKSLANAAVSKHYERQYRKNRLNN